MEQLFEIRHAEGKSLGCFACRFIQKGTKIVTERALIHIHGSLRQSIAAFNGLTLNEKCQFISPHASRGGAFSTSHKPQIDNLDDIIQEISMTNSFSITRGMESILAVLVAGVNHSCLPNAEQLYIAEEGVSTLWTIKDIPADEEITLSYIDEFRGYEERKKMLNDNWNIVCNCKACDATTEFGKASDCRRVVLQQNRKDIDNHVRSRTNDQEKSPFRNGDRGALDAVLETLDLLRLEGLPCAESE